MVKLRHSRVGPRKLSRPNSRTLIFTLFVTFTFLILILLTLGIPKPNQVNSISRNDIRSDDNDDKRWVEIISWEPRAFIHHNFLTKEECEHIGSVCHPLLLPNRAIINIAKPHMRKSAVVDNITGKSLNSSGRTSSGTFLARGRDQIVRNIEKRIADITFIPVEHGENLNVLHYEVGQKYDSHLDYFMDKFSTKNGGQRIATMLMYLSDVEDGGETVFPVAKGNFSSVPWWNELSDCGKKGLSVKPKMGDAILFWSMKPDSTQDPLSLHGACPVIKGDKWSCAKWMRMSEYINPF